MFDHADSIQDKTRRARAAQQVITDWSQDQVDAVVAAAGWSVWKEAAARSLAEKAVQETGLGRITDTYERHRLRVWGLLSDLYNQTTCGQFEASPETGIAKFAQPVGIVAIMIPATAPTAAVACNALNILKTRNAAVFCPNPRAQEVAAETVQVLRAAIEQAGAPADLLQILEVPNRHAAKDLSTQCDLVIATGGTGVVDRARRGPTPALLAGVGNATVLVDDTADVEVAAAEIVRGKSFDNSTSCSAENVVLVDTRQSRAFMNALQQHGAHLVTDDEALHLDAFLHGAGQGGRTVAGRSAVEVAAQAGLDVGPTTTILAVRPDAPASCSSWSAPKLFPVLTIWDVAHFAEGAEILLQVIQNCGIGHSCGLFSACADRAAYLAAHIPVGRVMFNQSTGMGNTGGPHNNMPFTMTLGCGVWGGGLTTDNVSWRHLLNVTTLCQPAKRAMVPPLDLFETVLDCHCSG